MDWRRGLIIGLAVGHVLLWAFYPPLNLWALDGDSWGLRLLDSLASGQACPLALWIVFAGRGVAWRILLVALAIVTYSGMLVHDLTLFRCYGLHYYGPGRESQLDLVVLVPLSLPLLPPMLLARASGLCIAQSDCVQQDCPTNARQLSISQMLICMTALAILMAGEACLDWSRIGHWLCTYGAILYITLQTAVSLTLVWLMLRARPLVSRVSVFSVLLAALAWFLLPSFRFLLYQAAWIVGSLLIVRLAGYRLRGWRR